MKQAKLNAILDASAFATILCLATTGLVLRYQLPPGSGSAMGRGTGRGSMQRPVDLLWGMTRHEWGDVHYWIAVALLAVLAVHLFLHWKWIVCVVRGQRSDASGRRLAVGACAFTLVVFIAVLPLLSKPESMTRKELQEQRSEQVVNDSRTP